MPSLDVRSPAGGSEGSVDLPESVFGAQVNVPLIHQVVVAQLAAARQGTSKTKTRSEVSGGGRKPSKQKGTGRARQGSTRAPQMTGGGVVHGPVPRSYAQRTPKKMKAAALRSVLSDRARNGRIHVVSGLIDSEAPSTKLAAAALASLLPNNNRHVLVVVDRTDETTWYSLRNLGHVHLLTPDQLNTYDVMLADDVVFTRQSLADFLETPVANPSDRSRKLPAEDDVEVLLVQETVIGDTVVDSKVVDSTTIGSSEAAATPAESNEETS